MQAAQTRQARGCVFSSLAASRWRERRIFAPASLYGIRSLMRDTSSPHVDDADPPRAMRSSGGTASSSRWRALADPTKGTGHVVADDEVRLLPGPQQNREQSRYVVEVGVHRIVSPERVPRKE